MRSSKLRIIVIAAILVLIAAGAIWYFQSRTPTAAPQAAPQVAAQPTTVPSSPTAPGPSPTPTLAPNQFENPVINADFPDPDIVLVGDTYYAYATGPLGQPTNLQAARSKDLVTWEPLGEALPALPLWAKAQAGVTWAPDVSLAADGKTLIMYYTTHDAASNKQCIGVATATKPEAAFQSQGVAKEKPFICQPQEGGSIDPASFVDEDGSRYVVWKSDGNCCNMDTWIYIQKVSADGLTLQAQPTRLIKEDQAWEGNIVEGPTLWKHNKKYYLFYSANWYKGEKYAVGYAVSDSVLGPYRKPDKPILTTDMQNGAAFGPGGQDIIEKNGKDWIVYHSWDPTFNYRWLQIDPLLWEGDAPKVDGPHRSPEPKP